MLLASLWRIAYENRYVNLHLSEVYLDESISSNGNNLTLQDYDLFRAAHLSNVEEFAFTTTIFFR